MAHVVSSGILMSFFISYVTSFGTSSLFRDQQQLFTGSRTPQKDSNLKESEISDYLLNYRGSNSDSHGASAQFMLHLFKDLVHGKKLDEAVGHTDGQTRNFIQQTDTIRSFSPKTKTRGKYLFAIPYLPTQERPQLAELRFNQLHHAQTYRKVTLIVKRNGLHREKSFKKTLGYSKAGVLDITNITVPFLFKFHGNLTIKIKVQYKNPYKVDKVNSEISDPILVVYSQDKDFLKTFYSSYSSLTSQHEETVSNSRTKRSSEGKKTGRKRKKNKWKPNEICKLHKFKVDFDLIGWGPWIVHPKKFNAKVCFGQCPAPITHEYTPTNHAMLQTLMRMKRPLSAPEPCCVPTKLRPLSMLYYEYDDIVVRHHQDMIATECGCR